MLRVRTGGQVLALLAFFPASRAYSVVHMTGKLCSASALTENIIGTRGTLNDRRSGLAMCSSDKPQTATYVGGPIYHGPEGSPQVRLFTKAECTLCDKVKDVLKQVQTTHPHSLAAVDITDPQNQEWWDKYKYDIPVLHLNGRFWIKHRLSAAEAQSGLDEAVKGTFLGRSGEPNAKKLERKA